MKKKSVSSSPATKSDSHRLQNIEAKVDVMDAQLILMDGRFDTVDGRLDRVDKRLETLEGAVRNLSHDVREVGNTMAERIDQTLAVLGNIEKRLAGKTQNHEKRITRLEVHAGMAA